MRTYRNNTPQAAARIVALTMLADGNLCKSELDMLEKLGVDSQLGLAPLELQSIVHGLCEDLQATSHLSWEAACIDPETLSALLGEVDQPALQNKVLELCMAVMAADKHVSEGETLILTAAAKSWGLSANSIQPTGAN